MAETIPYRRVKPYRNVIFLTDLYLKRGWSLRRISNELGCCKATVRKKLIEAEIEIKDLSKNEYKSLKNKITEMRNRGLGYLAIANSFNAWKVSTRSNEGVWHAKTVRDIDD